METQTMTVAQIEAQLCSARERLGQLDNEAKALALPAVSGTEEAANDLAKVNASIRQVTADISVLNNARLAAMQEKAKADAEASAEYRARHAEIARERAAELMTLAHRADEMVDAFEALLSDLAQTESDVWDALRQAGEQPNIAIIGRRDLGRFLIERVLATPNGQKRFLAEQRPIAAIAAAAWGDLLENEGASDE